MPVAMRSYDLNSSLGVGAHIDEGLSAASSYSASDIGAQLSYLGISYVRTDSPYQNVAEYLALGKQGIKFELVTVKDHGHPVSLAYEMALLNSIAPYVATVEGPNEVNGDPIYYAGLTGAAAARQFQSDLYAAVHADPALTGVTVMPFSLSQGFSIDGFGDVSAAADVGNAHAYASDGVPPYYLFPYVLDSVSTTTNKPFIITETGYATVFNGGSGVNQDVQAKWLLDIALDNHALHGVLRTFMYQLEDDFTQPANSQEVHYGFFNVDGTPKQSAIDMHNMLEILKDNGPNAATFTAGTLNYSLSNYYTGYNFDALFQKSNGVFDIAVWSEPQFYNAHTNVENYVAPLTSSVTLGGYYDVSVYDPLVGVSAIATYHNVNQISFTIATDPLIIEVSPVGSTPAVYAVVAPPPANGSTVVTPPPVVVPPVVVPPVVVPPVVVPPVVVPTGPVTLGTGPDSIILGVSEDAYLGDDQFNVFVDGTQIGGTQTATASHALGQDQQFTLNGTFAPGKHQVTTVFLNDLSGAGGDRTLYIDTTTIAGVTNKINVVMPWTGYTNFTVTVPTPIVTPPPTATVLGSGPDSIGVSLSEDAYKGDVQFTLSVDGQQIGGTQTATALHSLGQTAAYTLNGTFGAGRHAVIVYFLNDLSGAGGDRTLYIDNTTVAGTTTPLNIVMPWTGSSFFFVKLPPATPAAPTATVLGSGPDSIGVSLSEDAYKGDVQFTLSVDGQQIGGTQTATASHSLGQTAAYTLNGTFGAGRHAVIVYFLNDLSGAGGDRTLYIDSTTVAGTKTPLNITMPWTGSSFFFVNLPSTTKGETLAASSAATVTTPGDTSTPSIDPSTLGSVSPTLDFIVASGATVIDSALAGGLPLTGTAAQNAYLIHAGDVSDTIASFNTNPVAGDFLELAGYGAGASLTQVDATTWAASSASGSVHDLVHFNNPTPLVPANYVFV